MARFIFFGKKKVTANEQKSLDEQAYQKLIFNHKLEAFKSLKERDQVCKVRKALAKKLARAEDGESREMLIKELKGKKSLLNALTRNYQFNTLRADVLKVNGLIQKSLGAVSSIEVPGMAGVQLSQLQGELESLRGKTLGQQVEIDEIEKMLDQLADNTGLEQEPPDEVEFDEIEDMMLEEGKASEEEMVKHLLEKY